VYVRSCRLETNVASHIDVAKHHANFNLSRRKNVLPIRVCTTPRHDKPPHIIILDVKAFHLLRRDGF